jgi:hypothetical protein
MRKGNEIDIDREQHQSDRHQQNNDVLAINDDAGDGNAEQHRGENQIMA